MNITKYRDMRNKLNEQKLLASIQIITDELSSLIATINDTSNNIQTDDIVKQLQEIRDFSESIN